MFNFKKTAIGVFSLIVFNFGYSQKAFIPEPTLNVVSDFENLLSEEEKGILARDIKAEYNSNSNQLMIVTIPTSYIGNLTIENYAQQLFDKWQPGQKDLNNGVLLIVCGSKIDSVGRKLRIHTGYGIEGALPDLLCSKIEKELMVMELKRGNYFKALKNGTASILNFTSKENIGKMPKYKIEVLKPDALVYDPAQIFSDNEKEQLEEALKGSFNKKRYSIITGFGYNNVSDNVYISNRSSYDTVLLNITFNPGYFIDSKDSTLKFDTQKKNYYLSYYGSTGEFNLHTDEFYKFQDSIAKTINETGIFKTVNFFISNARVEYAGRLRWSAYFFGTLLAVSLFVFVIFKITKKSSNNIKNKKHKFIKISLGILLIIINVYSALSLVIIEMLYYIIFGNYLDLNIFQVILLMVLLAISHVFNIIFVYKIDANYFDSKLFSWIGKGGNGGSTYSSSSLTSSSYNSSSHSSSSSSGSSNGGYYGGGGKSGGGGASSDW